MINKPPEKAYLSDNRATNISKSFTNKMAAKTNRHRYGTKLRHCHPMCIVADNNNANRYSTSDCMV